MTRLTYSKIEGVEINYFKGGKVYSVYKYVPYGPFKEDFLYLLRRATENQGILRK